ncbi:hypothetical protein QQS21_007424 [Conoideocrella luteorostrata]|uniref:Uncharacterized protein n=1 Tax=Conoideocrella luteorostrata TaxID=1105319 RepID=A0AAJ0CLK6_9HYPO|nr:hypothetical protein QQS21_007424 [Conoideocrella luteorostrata]
MGSEGELTRVQLPRIPDSSVDDVSTPLAVWRLASLCDELEGSQLAQREGNIAYVFDEQVGRRPLG